ncbi:MAG TPA: hypothetical protein VNU70_10275, partial [Puia sp.]|nr:hypothetical protein [Puia sp.]
MLNVLTILTYIGCGIGFLFSLYGFVNAQATYDNMVKMQDKLDEMPGFVRRMMGPDPVGMSLKLLENRTPIFLLNIVAYLLCLYGAIQMRRLKKTGYSIYVLGQIVPFVTTFIFIGSMPMGVSTTFAVLLVLLFLILYATQLKYMK